MSFVHLHLHTQYSLLDGAITIEALAGKAKEYRMPAVAMTDHGNLFGAVEFYQKVSKEGVKPIIGCEVYIESQGSRFDKKVRRGYEPYHHLTLLAMDLPGYRNLCRLVTAAHLEGFYYKPRIDKEILKEYHEGLIVLSGCLSSELAETALSGGDPEKTIDFYRSLFGDRFYLEVQENGIARQSQFNEILKNLSERFSIPLVATNDCHYLRREDAQAHEALLCIQTGKTLQDADRMRFETDAFYFRSGEEMKKLFGELPQAVDATLAVAGRCHLELDFKTYHFPKFEPPAGKTLDQHLEEQTLAGFEGRWASIRRRLCDLEEAEERRRYEDRLRQEIEMIRKTGFAGYFLIVADFIRYAKEIGIPVGPGRGSAAGSLVVYCLGITDLDPMPYHLLFERFLNPERISMPDMDIDFCMDRRDEVIHYVQAKYGNVAQIITFGKMKAKAVVRDVGRVLNMPYGEVDRIAKMIPNALNITLDEALRQEPRLRELAEKESRVKEMMSIAHSLEGLNRHASTHAAGVVISDRPLVEFLPLAVGQKGETVTQYDMKAVEEVGLVKFDFLGLKTLTVIHHALKIIRRTRGEEIAISEIPLDDPEVYQYLSHGNTAGIFQLESSGMRELIVKLKPTAFPDLIALVALYRPGPLGSGMVDDFINRKHGRVQARYELPALESILRETHGVIVYQEQVMQIASAIANFSLGDADILRRAMGKKKPAEMAEQKDKFLKGCLANKIAEKKADKIFDLMAKFAEYGFNKSHSAAYAFISYQTAYLKTHFPVEFMASLLTHEMGNTDKVMAYISHCREIGISILPPDINQSFTDFSVVGESQIRFGLAAVKNVGVVAIESILEVREEKEGFASLIDFCESVDLRKVNRRVIEGLICCGAFDSLGVRRAQAMAGLTELIEHGSRVQRERNSNQAPLFAGSSPGARSFSLPESAEWGMRERLLHEKESLGFYITGHPLDEYRLELAESRAQTLHSLPELADGSTVLVVGVVSALREIVTRNGDRMGFVTLEDLSGTVQVVVFSDLYNNCLTLLKGQDPILVRGQTDQGEEGVKVIAREIAALRRAEGSSSGASPSGASPIGASPLRELHLHLETGQVSRPQLERLKEILAGHHGSSPVSLHFRELNKKETVLALPEDLMVDPSHELIQKLDQLFGGPVALVRS